MTHSSAEIVWTGRPKSRRLLESLAFSGVYLLVAMIFLPTVNYIVNDTGVSSRFLSVMILFAMFLFPIEISVWYGLGSKYRTMTLWRITAIGFLSILIPCLLSGVLTFGLAMFQWPIYLPPAIPLGIVLTWAFVRGRDLILRNT